MSFEFARQQYPNQYYTSDSPNYGHGNDIIMTTGKRPLIASSDHPLRRQQREMQVYDLENLLGFGPQWVDKNHLRNVCSARKAMPPICHQARDIRTCLGINYPRSTNMESSPIYEPILPKVESVIHSYYAGEKIGENSVVVDSTSPFGQSITAKQSYTAQGCSLSDFHQTKSFPQEKRNEDEVLTKYCKWFDSLSSSILGSNIGAYNLVDGGSCKKTKLKSDQICQALHHTTSRTGSTTPTYVNKNVQSKHVESCTNCSSFRTEEGKGESSRIENVTNPLNHEEKVIESKNASCVKGIDKELNIKDGELSVTPPILDEKGSEFTTDLETTNMSSQKMVEHNERRRGKKNELFVDRLVSIVKNYIEYRKQKDDQSKNDSNPKQENTGEKKIIKENNDSKEKGRKRKKRIEVLRRLVAQQEGRLAKLKRETGEIFYAENVCREQNVSWSIKNESLHHGSLGVSENELEDI